MMVPSEPSPWVPPSATMKLKAPYGVSRKVGIAVLASGRRSHTSRVAGPLADAEDYVFGGLGRRDADQRDHSAVVEIVLRHRRAVAMDEIRLLGFLADQRAIAPERQQEIFNGLPDIPPQPVVVGLEHRPLRALVDRVLEEDEQPTDIHV